MQSPFIWIFAFLRHFVVYFRQFDTSKPSGTEIDEVFLETGRQGVQDITPRAELQGFNIRLELLELLDSLSP